MLTRTTEKDKTTGFRIIRYFSGERCKLRDGRIESEELQIEGMLISTYLEGKNSKDEGESKSQIDQERTTCFETPFCYFFLLANIQGAEQPDVKCSKLGNWSSPQTQ